MSPIRNKISQRSKKQQELDPKDMPETAFIIFFSFKYKEALDYDLEEALCKNERDEILEKLLLYFLKNLKNQDKLINPISLHKELVSHIDNIIQEDKGFYTRVNPLKNVENFYKLSVRDKVLILKDMVIKQFYVSTKIKELVKKKYPMSKGNDSIPFDVEKIGSDSDGSKYYYVGIGSRIYKESIVNNNVLWSVGTTTVEDVANLEKYFEKRLTGIPLEQQHADERSFYQNLRTVIEQKLPKETRLKIYKLRQNQLIQKKIELSKKNIQINENNINNNNNDTSIEKNDLKPINSPKRIRIKTGTNNNILQNKEPVVIAPVVVVGSSDRKIYIPNSIELQKLEWSLNHRFFLEEEAKYDESENTDADLSS
ncbi:20307_t:CDS:2 [Entrophospora sp. SA101]|nr:20307_t:CDS:2 [Entrophospora sp. SA101]CAJ0909736.1 16678_t:CDS:2 [Entrophospora sp. SA101]